MAFGGLNFGSQHSSPDGDENFVENKALLNYSNLSEGSEAVKPSSMAFSEFNFLPIIGNIVKINQILLEDDTASDNRNSEHHLIIKEFHAFLSDFKDVLDEATTMRLLESKERQRKHWRNETHEVIKYLEYCVHRLHNEEDDSALLRFLQFKFGKGWESSPEFFYDPKYALCLCLKEKRMHACVHIYSMMSMHEEEVALALQVDPELAMAEADKVEDDEDLRKKL